MPTPDLDADRYGPPADPRLQQRKSELLRLGIDPQQPRPEFDAIARDFALEASQLVGHEEIFGFVNIITEEQHFVGLYVPTGNAGSSQATLAPPPAAARTMPRSEGWCPYVINRHKALPLSHVDSFSRGAVNPAIYKLNAKAYLGAPLVHPATGITLGTVCLVATREIAWGHAGVALSYRHADHAMRTIGHLADPG